MHFSAILALLPMAVGSYSPDTNDDWRVLVPAADSPAGAYNSLPFKFGIIANAYQSQISSPLDTVSNVQMKSLELIDIDATGGVGDTDIVVEGESSPDTGALLSTDGYTPGTENTPEAAAELYNEVYVSSYGLHSPHGGVSVEKRSASDPDTKAVGADTKLALEIKSLVPVACVTDSVLQLQLEKGILRLNGDRIGSIVSSHQFQFDGPVPQHGALYAAGWLVTKEGLLCLGNNTLFYRCTSGDFYKLYDASIGGQCSPVQLDVIELISC